MACHAYAPCTRHAHALCTCLRVHRRLLRRGVRLDGGAGVVGQRESESGAGDKVAPHPWRCRHGVRRSRRHVVIWDSHRTGRHDAGHEASLFKGAPCGSHRRCVPWRGRPSGCVPSSAGAQARADAAHQLRGGWFGFGRKPFFSARPKKAGGGDEDCCRGKSAKPRKGAAFEPSCFAKTERSSRARQDAYGATIYCFPWLARKEKEHTVQATTGLGGTSG